jgi:hypothetical protein
MDEAETKEAERDAETAALLRTLADRMERGEADLLIVVGVHDAGGTQRFIRGHGRDTILLGMIAGLMLDAQRVCD